MGLCSASPHLRTSYTRSTRERLRGSLTTRRIKLRYAVACIFCAFRCTHQCCIHDRGIFPSEAPTGQCTVGEKLRNSGLHTPAGLPSSHTPAQTHGGRDPTNDLLVPNIGMCHKPSRKSRLSDRLPLTWQTLSFKDAAPILPFTSTCEDRLSFQPAGSTYGGIC